MNLVQLLVTCAGFVHPQTMVHVIQAESGGSRWALNVNDGPSLQLEGESAVEAAKYYLDQGKTVDVGLTQLNSQHFDRFDLTVSEAFKPCNNVRAGATVLKENYQRATGKHLPVEKTLDQALSYYNTGDAQAGQENGYVARVRDAETSHYDVPALQKATRQKRERAQAKQEPAWDIFGDLTQRGRWLANEKAQGSRARAASNTTGRAKASGHEVHNRGASQTDHRTRMGGTADSSRNVERVIRGDSQAKEGQRPFDPDNEHAPGQKVAPAGSSVEVHKKTIRSDDDR